MTKEVFKRKFSIPPQPVFHPNIYIFYYFSKESYFHEPFGTVTSRWILLPRTNRPEQQYKSVQGAGSMQGLSPSREGGAGEPLFARAALS